MPFKSHWRGREPGALEMWRGWVIDKADSHKADRWLVIKSAWGDKAEHNRDLVDTRTLNFVIHGCKPPPNHVLKYLNMLCNLEAKCHIHMKCILKENQMLFNVFTFHILLVIGIKQICRIRKYCENKRVSVLHSKGDNCKTEVSCLLRLQSRQMEGYKSSKDNYSQYVSALFSYLLCASPGVEWVTSMYQENNGVWF